MNVEAQPIDQEGLIYYLQDLAADTERSALKNVHSRKVCYTNQNWLCQGLQLDLGLHFPSLYQTFITIHFW